MGEVHKVGGMSDLGASSLVPVADARNSCVLEPRTADHDLWSLTGGQRSAVIGLPTADRFQKKVIGGRWSVELRNISF